MLTVIIARFPGRWVMRPTSWPGLFNSVCATLKSKSHTVLKKHHKVWHFYDHGPLLYNPVRCNPSSLKASFLHQKGKKLLGTSLGHPFLRKISSLRSVGSVCVATTTSGACTGKAATCWILNTTGLRELPSLNLSSKGSLDNPSTFACSLF